MVPTLALSCRKETCHGKQPFSEEPLHPFIKCNNKYFRLKEENPSLDPGGKLRLDIGAYSGVVGIFPFFGSFLLFANSS